jgi:hypothetical protein
MLSWLAQHLMVTGLLAAAVAVMGRFLRLSPAAKHLLWLLVLLKLLAPPVVSWPWGVRDCWASVTDFAPSPPSAPGAVSPGEPVDSAEPEAIAKLPVEVPAKPQGDQSAKTPPPESAKVPAASKAPEPPPAKEADAKPPLPARMTGSAATAAVTPRRTTGPSRPCPNRLRRNWHPRPNRRATPNGPNLPRPERTPAASTRRQP